MQSVSDAVECSKLPRDARILVVGASRGIGLEMARLLSLGRPAGRVFAAARHPDQSSALRSLLDQAQGRIIAVAVDIGDEDSVRAAAEAVGETTERLDLIVNCAGLLHEGQHLAPERKLAQIQPENLERLFRVHSIGPLLLAKHFQSVLPRGDRFVFASLSARVGSIGDNRLGGWYGYRISKAAHNMAIKTLSIELARRSRDAVCIALHPGTVDTELSRPFSERVSPQRLFTPDRAARQLLAVIDSAETKDNGHFFAWDGSEIPW